MLHPIVFIGPEHSCGKIASCRTIFQATLTLFLRIVTLFPGIAGVFQVFTGLFHKNLRLFQMKSSSRVVISPLRLMNLPFRLVISPLLLMISSEKVVNFLVNTAQNSQPNASQTSHFGENGSLPNGSVEKYLPWTPWEWTRMIRNPMRLSSFARVVSRSINGGAGV